MSLLGRIKNFVFSTDTYTSSGWFSRFGSGVDGRSPRPTRANVDAFLARYADQAWVFACVNVIQDKGASVELKVYRRVGKNLQELPDHPLKKLLESVNPFMNGYDLLESLHGYNELTGNAVWLLDKMVDDKPTEIYPLNPGHIEPVITADRGLVAYKYRPNGKVVHEFNPALIVHFKKFNPLDPFWGMAPLSAARQSADAIQSADEFNTAFFRNSAEAGGYLTTDKTLPDETIKNIKSVWSKQHRGLRKAHEIGILHGGLKFENTTLSHREMQFPELKRMSREDVLAVYKVPPAMVGVFDEANYSNADAQERFFWKNCMLPRLRKIESVLNEWLAPSFEGDIVLRFDLSTVQELQDDAKMAADRDAVLTASGISTINEVRAQRNLPKVAWGDTWNAPFGLAPIDDRPEPVSDPGEVDPEEEPEAPPVPAAEEEEEDSAKAAKGELRRTAIWHHFKGHTENMERRWFPRLRTLFSSQEREVIRNLKENWQRTATHLRLNGLKNIKQDVSVILFDRGAARRIFQKDGRRLLELALAESAKREVRTHDLDIQFQITNPNVVQWLQEKAFKFANEVNEATEDALRKTLAEAVTAGETIAEVEKRIESVFDIARGPRTQRIARTEVISASNEGAMAAYEQSGVVQGVEWVSSRDTKVRDEHRIDGESVTMGRQFSNGLKYPGDPSGDASNVINCRCTVAPVIAKE